MMTTKELDYLKDLFNLQFIAYKTTLDAKGMISNNKLINHLDKALNALYDNMDEILIKMEDIINE